MSNDRRASTHNTITVDNDDQFRDIQVLTPPSNPSRPRTQAWETSSHRSTVSDATNSSENFTTVSREFNALVLAGSAFTNNRDSPSDVVQTPTPDNRQLDMIGEGEEETNPLAIVVDNHPLNSPAPVSVQRVKKDEVEAKISAWQNAKVAKINNRFKREDAVIHGWENEQVQKATSAMKKIERKLEEKRAKAMEKMQNQIAKAHRKAEERRASSEAKKGTKVARVLELANLMRAVGKPPTKRSFF